MGLGFREGACVEARFAIGHNTRAFRFGGNRGRHLDRSLGSRLRQERRKTSNYKLGFISPGNKQVS